MEPLKRLEQELNSFPRNVEMDKAAKAKIYQAITGESKTSGKYLRRPRTPVKVWLVSLVTVAIVCMLFLPSILNGQSLSFQKSTQGNPIDNKGTSTVPEQHPATNLSTAKELYISKDDARNDITDMPDLEKISKSLTSSTFYSKPNNKIKDYGTNYILTFLLSDGAMVEFQYRPQLKPNLFDIEKQEWRQSKDFESIIAPYLPAKNLSEQQLRSILQKLYPSVHFDTEYGVRIEESKPLGLPGTQVVIAEGTNNLNQRMKAYLNPKDGSVIKEEPPLTTNGVSNAVKGFFQDLHDKNGTDAWDYVYSKAKNPNRFTTEATVQNAFTNYVQKTNTKVKSIESIKWEDALWKNPDCECFLEDSVVVNAIMSDSSTKHFHVLLDADHKWKLYYSVSSNDLE